MSATEKPDQQPNGAEDDYAMWRDDSVESHGVKAAFMAGYGAALIAATPPVEGCDGCRVLFPGNDYTRIDALTATLDGTYTKGQLLHIAEHLGTISLPDVANA